jgi:hypothetical protein
MHVPARRVIGVDSRHVGGKEFTMAKKCITLRRGQKTLPKKYRKGKGTKAETKGKWREHNSSYAIDPWGKAIRDLEEAGKL